MPPTYVGLKENAPRTLSTSLQLLLNRGLACAGYPTGTLVITIPFTIITSPMWITATILWPIDVLGVSSLAGGDNSSAVRKLLVHCFPFTFFFNNGSRVFKVIF